MTEIMPFPKTIVILLFCCLFSKVHPVNSLSGNYEVYIILFRASNALVRFSSLIPE